MEARQALPPEAEALAGWADARTEALGPNRPLEATGQWAEPLVACETDRRHVLVRLGASAGRLRYRAGSLDDAPVRLAEQTDDAALRSGVGHLRAPLTALEADFPRALAP